MFSFFSLSNKNPQTPTRRRGDGNDDATTDRSPPSGQAPRSMDMVLEELHADLQCLQCAFHIAAGDRCTYTLKSTRQKACSRCRSKSLGCVLVSLIVDNPANRADVRRLRTGHSR